MKNITTSLQNIENELKELSALLFDLLKVLGVDVNGFKETYSTNLHRTEEKELSDYRL